ncbi:MAG: zf-HC2 domain-containing protein [Chloroflexi bacterium]|nr:zf-HC2 domain-containing protein [Chloroflexota bacterium]
MFRNISSDPHARVEEKLSEYIDDQLAPADRARVDAHLRGCARCRASLASLEWTIALAKRAPAPALPRGFELPIAASPSPFRRAVRGEVVALRFATTFATILLVAVIGFDFFLQSSALRAPALAPGAEQFAAPASGAQPTAAPASGAPPTTAPASGLQSTPAPRALPPAAQPQSSATDAAKSAVDAASTGTPPPKPAALPRATTTAVPTSQPAALPLATPTRTSQVEARAEESAREDISPVRVIEIILLALVLAFGAATVIARKNARR